MNRLQSASLEIEFIVELNIKDIKWFILYLTMRAWSSTLQVHHTVVSRFSKVFLRQHLYEYVFGKVVL